MSPMHVTLKAGVIESYNDDVVGGVEIDPLEFLVDTLPYHRIIKSQRSVSTV